MLYMTHRKCIYLSIPRLCKKITTASRYNKDRMTSTNKKNITAHKVLAFPKKKSVQECWRNVQTLVFLYYSNMPLAGQAHADWHLISDVRMVKLSTTAVANVCSPVSHVG